MKTILCHSCPFADDCKIYEFHTGDELPEKEGDCAFKKEREESQTLGEGRR